MTLPAALDSGRVRLGDSGWSIWPDVALRSAGFPARWILRLHDDRLAAAADAVITAAEDESAAAEQPATAAGDHPTTEGESPTSAADRYAAAYAEACARLSGAVRQTAADPLFREAIAWQNPALIGTCLDKAAAGEPRNVRGRNHEAAVVSYLQRYACKNDSIGFFGPVGWASAAASAPGFRVCPGPALLRRRRTYFESWCIDELARTVAGQRGMLPWLRPRLDAACRLTGDRMHRPRRSSLVLTAGQARLAALVDGVRTVGQLLAATDGDEWTALQSLLELEQLGVLTLEPLGPIEAWPERTLGAELGLIGDPDVRQAALRPLTELVAARDAVAAAAGNPDAVLAAGAALADAFRAHTGRAGTRRPGSNYAGRTLLYEDTVRDVEIELGPVVLAALAAPLGLVLDSTRWLVERIANAYRHILTELYHDERARTGLPEVPISRLLGLAVEELAATARTVPPPVVEVQREFQRRWAGVLATALSTITAAGHQYRWEDLAPLVAATFPVTGEPAWSNAAHHSPDVLLAATGAEAVAAGDFLLVLGELHVASNTIESRLFVEQHADPARLLGCAEADQPHRIYAIPPKGSRFVSSRVAPPTALLSPRWTYWSQAEGPDTLRPPGPVLAAADLVAVDSPAGVLVRSRGTGARFDLLETLGELLSGAVVNAFRPLPAADHQPRVTVDRLVLARESWRLPVAEAGWAFVRDERERYLAARRWRHRLGLPEFGFVTAPVEDKPTALDFGSLALVNLLAKLIRRTAEADPGAAVRISELLPGLDQLWLPDAHGERYTCELRMVAYDERRRDGR